MTNDTPQPAPGLDEHEVYVALSNVLLAHRPQASPLGETRCACGMIFHAIDARAWHRHAAAMVHGFLAALPASPAPAKEMTQEELGRITFRIGPRDLHDTKCQTCGKRPAIYLLARPYDLAPGGEIASTACAECAAGFPLWKAGGCASAFAAPVPPAPSSAGEAP